MNWTQCRSINKTVITKILTLGLVIEMVSPLTSTITLAWQSASLKIYIELCC